jgi:hypothetical protein
MGGLASRPRKAYWWWWSPDARCETPVARLLDSPSHSAQYSFLYIVHSTIVATMMAMKTQSLLGRTRSAISVRPTRRARSSATTRTVTRASSSSSSDEVPAPAVAAAVAALALEPICFWSEYTVVTTGEGLQGDILGGLEGLSYLAVLGMVAWSLKTKVSTGSGLPAGPSGLIGAAEGVAYLALLGFAAFFFHQ